MSGHSKWANIKRRKAQVDEQKGRVFSRLARELTVAARQGGPNPEANPRLREAIARAREANIPAGNLQRAILKGTGELAGAQLEESLYEGYGPGGIAVVVETVTDNRRRTAAAVRHVFARHGGSLGEAGCVVWMFDQKALITADGEVAEGRMLAAALDAGAEDLARREGDYLITADPRDRDRVRAALEALGITVKEAEVTLVPRMTVEVPGDQADAAVELLAELDELEDVQRVHANVAMG
ncbi:MAG TPA: YebC/PmpR family DNA-binding transcriptional regulator [Bacillota bacterium]|nr:YebC/PmpR family DNA-binding transcriptional regulator [Bacillota bacterium]